MLRQARKSGKSKEQSRMSGIERIERIRAQGGPCDEPSLCGPGTTKREKLGGRNILMIRKSVMLHATLLAFVLFTALSGKAQVTTGTISGTVTDSTGAVMPGATVVIQNEDTGISRTVTANASGRYSAPSLSLGKYRVTGTREGFQSEVRSGIELTIGREAIVDLRLAVGAVTQTVEVTGEAPLVETTDTTVGYLVADQTIRDLPLNERDLTNLVLLDPGVGQAMNATTTSSYTGWGKYISISGGRSEDNSYLLDGSYIGDFNHHVPTGPSGALLGTETVREFQVLTNDYSAQFGRVMGGVFNAVSKSGTNQLHGDFYEYLRNSDLDAATWANNAFGGGLKSPFRRNQFGGTVGGPIKRDKMFFFLGYEGMREALTSTDTDQVPDVNARQGIIPALGITAANPIAVSPKIQPFLNAIPLPNPNGIASPTLGTRQFIFPGAVVTRDDFGQGRFDYSVSSNDNFFVRFTGSDGQQIAPMSLPEFQQTGLLGSDLATAAETHIFSPRALNTFTLSFSRVNPTDGGIYPQVSPALVSVPGQVTAGVGYGWEGNPKPFDQFLTNRFNYKDDVSLNLGRHSVVFGGMLERMQFNEDQPNRPYGSWTFADIVHFLEAQPRQYRGTPPQLGNATYNFVRGMRQWFSGLYVQDNWRVTERFNLTLGVRWEPYTVPTEVNNLLSNIRHLSDPGPTVGGPFWQNDSPKDIGPRFGFAWSPLANGKTSVRGGFGIFYMPNDPTTYYVQATRIPPYSPELTFTTINPNLFPDAIATILAAGIPNGSPNAMQYTNFKSPRTYQYNINVQQQFGQNMVLMIGYVGNRGVDKELYSNINAPLAVYSGTSLVVPTTATNLNPNYVALQQYGTGGNSWYNGLATSLTRKYSHGLQMQVSYTFSKALDTSDANASVDHTGSGSVGLLYPPNPSINKGLSGYDIANRLVGSYSYELPLGTARSGITGHLVSGWQISGIVTLQSGQPFTVSNASGATSTALSALGYSTRPNVNNAFAGNPIEGGPNQYFNPAMFYEPAGSMALGNAGRNILTGPGLATWDSALNKTTAINERWKLQFRAELFNLLNRPNFALPTATIFTTGGARVSTAGLITNTVGSSRQIQFGLKLMF